MAVKCTVQYSISLERFNFTKHTVHLQTGYGSHLSQGALVAAVQYITVLHSNVLS